MKKGYRAPCSEALQYLEVQQQRKKPRETEEEEPVWQTGREGRSEQSEKVGETAELNACWGVSEAKTRERLLLGKQRPLRAISLKWW